MEFAYKKERKVCEKEKGKGKKERKKERKEE